MSCGFSSTKTTLHAAHFSGSAIEGMRLDTISRAPLWPPALLAFAHLDGPPLHAERDDVLVAGPCAARAPLPPRARGEPDPHLDELLGVGLLLAHGIGDLAQH